MSWWDRLYAHILCHRITVLHMLFPHYSQLMLQAHTALVPFHALCGNLSQFFPMYTHLFGSLFLPQSIILYFISQLQYSISQLQHISKLPLYIFLLYFLFNTFKCICHNCSLYLEITTVTSHNGNNYFSEFQLYFV